MSAYLPRALFCAVTLCMITSPAFAEPQTFNDVLAVVYQSNPQLAAARAQLRAVDEQVPEALSGWHPSVTATAEAGKSDQNISGNGIIPRQRTSYPSNIGVNVTQPVFSGFKTVSGVDSAEASVKAQRASLQDTEQKVLFDAAKAYLDVVQAQAILDLDKESETILQKKVAEVQDRLRIQELSKTDLSQTKSRLDAATVARVQAEGDLFNQRATFTRLVGQVPGGLERPRVVYAIPKTLDEAIDASLKKNPAVVAASFSDAGAKADIKTARGNLLPAVDIVGTASRALDQGPLSPAQQNDTTVLVRLTVPLYQTGSDYAKTRAAEQTASQKSHELDDARNKAREQVSNAWQSLATTRDSRAGDESVVKAEEDAYNGVVLESKYGTRTTLDVLNAEQELVNARLNLVKIWHDEVLALMQLKAALGELTAESLGLPVNRYDPEANYKVVRNKWAGFAAVKDEEHDTK